MEEAGLSSTSDGRGIRRGAAGANSSLTSISGGGDREASEVSPKAHSSRRQPRILTVLTTYGKRSKFVKPYKEAVSGRSDGYRPTVSGTATAAAATAVLGFEMVWPQS